MFLFYCTKPKRIVCTKLEKEKEKDIEENEENGNQQEKLIKAQ